MTVERTIEITDYCPFDCSFCSSDSTDVTRQARWMPVEDVLDEMKRVKEDGVSVLHVSGGEPLWHPGIGRILYEAKVLFGRNVVVHTNLIQQIAYNARVIDGVRVHCLLTPEDVDEVHILKRVRQGREARVPEVHCSRNWARPCEEPCGHILVGPDGSRAPSPCKKGGE